MLGTINRINNAVEKIPQLLTQRRESLEGLGKQAETIRVELEKPFPHTRELEEKEERLTVLLHELAEAEKEQSAKRALKKAGSTQDAAVDREPGGDKPITAFLQNFQPEPVAASPQREPERER